MLNYGAGGTGLDGEGRVTQVTAQTEQNPVTGVTYTMSGTTQPIGSITQVTYGSADSDNFSYSPNTGALNSYIFHVGSQTVTGNLTWNTNGSFQQLQISDQLNAANSQTCTYLYDDLGRIGLPPGSTGNSVDCGASKWQQIFSYDAFGNIKKTVPTGGTGVSFTPTYATGTSRYTSLPGFTPTYDANGDLTADGAHSFAWDAEGHPVTVDTVGLTYDALGRMVEQARGSSFTQIVYGPTGKFALMNGQTLVKGFAQLPGGGTAVYTPGVLPAYYRHSDWLGSSRLATTPSRTVYYDTAYAPFGEAYVETGTNDRSFTDQNQDTISGLHDFMFREYNPAHGRWMSPDPAGMKAANLENPQTWNRYAYTGNTPLQSIDWLGLLNLDRMETRKTLAGDFTFGNDIFDAVVGAPGTFLRYDIYGNLSFGYSTGLLLATYRMIDSVRDAVENSSVSPDPRFPHDVTDPGPYPTGGFQLTISDKGVFVDQAGILPDYTQTKVQLDYLTSLALAYQDKGLSIPTSLDNQIDALSGRLNRIQDEIYRLILPGMDQSTKDQAGMNQ
jgi:RHS repeat-associated protein